MKEQSDLTRLYEWLMNEDREPANTFFTSGELRNVAKEIEFREQVNNTTKLEHKCKYIKRIGESCTLNDNCRYPNCGED